MTSVPPAWYTRMSIHLQEVSQPTLVFGWKRLFWLSGNAAHAHGSDRERLPALIPVSAFPRAGARSTSRPRLSQALDGLSIVVVAVGVGDQDEVGLPGAGGTRQGSMNTARPIRT